jgi:hypothetical protein
MNLKKLSISEAKIIYSSILGFFNYTVSTAEDYGVEVDAKIRR